MARWLGTPAEYNLLTFKALKDPLAAWTLKELAGHGVNYRTFVSPDLDHLLPEDQFRLLAASMHFPRQLASRVTLQPQGPGAYDVIWGVDTIRILVLREMPEAEQNWIARSPCGRKSQRESWPLPDPGR